MVHVGIKQEKKEDALGEALKWHRYTGERKEEIDEKTKKRIENLLRDLGFEKNK